MAATTTSITGPASLKEEKVAPTVAVAPTSPNEEAVMTSSPSPEQQTVPLPWKLAAVVLVTVIGFGSRWSSGITGAMKSTMKEEMDIDNLQFSLLEASEDFMSTALLLLSGVVTDRIGGAGAMLYGNAILLVGSLLVAGAAQTRSYPFMIAGRVVSALGDIATQIAQYKVFSSWFAPGGGFASVLGLELGIGKIGSFAGKASANPISVGTGDFAWVFWVAAFVNAATCAATLLFYWFTGAAMRRFPEGGVRDPTTGVRLAEKNKKFELAKVLELPWSFWCVMAFSLFQTSTASVFGQNSTELAEQRFDVDAVTAGWYSAVSQYAGFFLVPVLGVFIDVFGHRLSVLFVCGTTMFIAMILVCLGDEVTGTAASFGIYAISLTLGPTSIIDCIRTSMWHPGVFGSAYALKVTMNNAMNIIIRIITGVIQDRDNNSYNKVTIVYVVLAAMSVVVSLSLAVLGWLTVDLGHLQWNRKQRIARQEVLLERRRIFLEVNDKRNRRISVLCFSACMVFVLGSWCAYFWGVATGNNS